MKSHSPSPLEALFQRVRERVNGPMFQGRPIQTPSWKVCAAMDALEDTHMALQSFLKSDPPSDLGLKYLWIYGALQALYVQQDAFLGIAEALGKSCDTKDLPSEVFKIREDRNNIVGHPIYRSLGPQETRGTSHFLVQSELEAHLVKIVRFTPKSNAVEYSYANLGELVRIQEQSLAQELSLWLSGESLH